MGAKLKIGVFGGYRGQTMIDVLLDHPDAELAAVCDKYTPLLSQVREKAEKHGLNVACYESFDEFIKHDMDAVVLANYATEHAVYAVKCLYAGKHVLSEVLPCETVAQAVELIEAVEKTGLVYAYAENYCYMLHTFEMWQRYKKGDIGTVTYGEGEYIHDCAGIWPQITYGERDHWRNNLYCNYYCTHSVGPLLAMTGLRPVTVTGFECPPPEEMKRLGAYFGAGIEMVKLENGAVLKSIHGHLKREPGSINYELYGTKGMMETGRQEVNKPLYVYRESDKICVGKWEDYVPELKIEGGLAKNFAGHGGSDFYPTHFFIQKILGRPEGNEWSIDVYSAVSMGLCGIFAYRSVLDGGKPMQIPDLRDPAVREAYRHDNKCTNKKVAKDGELLPKTSYGEVDIPDEVYEHVRQLWIDGKPGE